MRRGGALASAPLHSCWVSVAGLRTHARVGPRSTGLPVILVHGVAVSSRYMIPTATRLAHDYRLSAPDLPGFGRSDHPPKPLDVVGLADALAAWMLTLGLRPSALVANSFGCQIVADLAARRPELVSHLVLTSPTVDPRARSLAVLAWRWSRDMPREPLRLGWVNAPDALDAGLRRSAAGVRCMLADRIEDKLPHVRAPTLVVRGGRDPIVPRDWAQQVARLVPGGRLVEIPAAAHALNFNAAAALARVVTGFLDGRPRATA